MPRVTEQVKVWLPNATKGQTPASHRDLHEDHSLHTGKVNIFNLAKNAGTSVEQIERFYAKHSATLAARWRRICRAFGEE